MRRHLIHFPVIIITFAVSLLLTPYSAVDGLRGLFSRVPSDSSYCDAESSSLSDYYGFWGGSGENVIELQEAYIGDVEKGKYYEYKVVRESRYQNGQKGVLIEVDGIEPGSNLRKFVYLGLKNGRLDYFGYPTLNDYNLGRETVSANFSRSFFE